MTETPPHFPHLRLVDPLENAVMEDYNWDATTPELGKPANYTPAYPVDALPSITSDANAILQEAGKLIDGDRDQQHGNRDDCLASITILWDTWDRIRKPGPPTSIDTCVKMVMVKLARIARGTHNRDNWRDGCGYLAMGGEQAEKANAARD
jgi:hypothetical protein